MSNALNGFGNPKTYTSNALDRVCGVTSFYACLYSCTFHDIIVGMQLQTSRVPVDLYHTRVVGKKLLSEVAYISDRLTSSLIFPLHSIVLTH